MKMFDLLKTKGKGTIDRDERFTVYSHEGE